MNNLEQAARTRERRRKVWKANTSRKRGAIMAFAGFFAIASWVTVASGAAAHLNTRPNLLLVLSDDHSAPHLGCYGNRDVHSPHLDRFAGQGIRFDRAYVAAPQCVPSRAAILTGRSPVRIAMTRFSAPLPADVAIFPQLLRDQGYFTGLAGRGYHLDGTPRPQASRDVFKERDLQTIARRVDYCKTSGGGAGGEVGSGALKQYREFLDLVPAGKPFFLQLCFSDPHRPFDGHDIPAPRNPAALTLPPGIPDTPAVRQDLAGYYDEISRLDGQFAQVMAELERRGLTTNTLVVFMGDNGASQLRGKGTLYEWGIHVPLLARWPGVIKPGGSSDSLISGEDLAPTFLESAGVAVPAELTGKSLLTLLRGQAFEARDYVYAERGPHVGLPRGTAAFDLGRVVVGRTHKLIYNALWQLPYEPIDFHGGAAWTETQGAAEQGKVPTGLVPLYTGQPRPMFEVYDLTADPHETNNIAGKAASAQIERDLKTALHRWMILERDYLPLPMVEGRNARGKNAHATPAESE